MLLVGVGVWKKHGSFLRNHTGARREVEAADKFSVWNSIFVSRPLQTEKYKDGIGDCKGRKIEACSCGGSLQPSSFETHSWH
jgi:hypothetical protein